ncbi:unnamed protein product, partial [Discosporangium mesarthrocarpum]
VIGEGVGAGEEGTGAGTRARVARVSASSKMSKVRVGDGVTPNNEVLPSDEVILDMREAIAFKVRFRPLSSSQPGPSGGRLEDLDEGQSQGRRPEAPGQGRGVQSERQEDMNKITDELKAEEGEDKVEGEKEEEDEDSVPLPDALPPVPVPEEEGLSVDIRIPDIPIIVSASGLTELAWILGSFTSDSATGTGHWRMGGVGRARSASDGFTGGRNGGLDRSGLGMCPLDMGGLGVRGRQSMPSPLMPVKVIYRRPRKIRRLLLRMRVASLILRMPDTPRLPKTGVGPEVLTESMPWGLGTVGGPPVFALCLDGVSLALVVREARETMTEGSVTLKVDSVRAECSDAGEGWGEKMLVAGLGREKSDETRGGEGEAGAGAGTGAGGGAAVGGEGRAGRGVTSGERDKKSRSKRRVGQGVGEALVVKLAWMLKPLHESKGLDSRIDDREAGAGTGQRRMGESGAGVGAGQAVDSNKSPPVGASGRKSGRGVSEGRVEGVGEVGVGLVMRSVEARIGHLFLRPDPPIVARICHLIRATVGAKDLADGLVRQEHIRSSRRRQGLPQRIPWARDDIWPPVDDPLEELTELVWPSSELPAFEFNLRVDEVICLFAQHGRPLSELVLQRGLVLGLQTYRPGLGRKAAEVKGQARGLLLWDRTGAATGELACIISRRGAPVPARASIKPPWHVKAHTMKGVYHIATSATAPPPKAQTAPVGDSWSKMGSGGLWASADSLQSEGESFRSLGGRAQVKGEEAVGAGDGDVEHVNNPGVDLEWTFTGRVSEAEAVTPGGEEAPPPPSLSSSTGVGIGGGVDGIRVGRTTAREPCPPLLRLRFSGARIVYLQRFTMEQYCYLALRLLPEAFDAPSHRPEDSLCGSPVAALAQEAGLGWVQGCTPMLPQRRRTEKACLRRPIVLEMVATESELHLPECSDEQDGKTDAIVLEIPRLCLFR